MTNIVFRTRVVVDIYNYVPHDSQIMAFVDIILCFYIIIMIISGVVVAVEVVVEVEAVVAVYVLHNSFSWLTGGDDVYTLYIYIQTRARLLLLRRWRARAFSVYRRMASLMIMTKTMTIVIICRYSTTYWWRGISSTADLSVKFLYNVYVYIYIYTYNVNRKWYKYIYIYIEW